MLSKKEVKRVAGVLASLEKQQSAPQLQAPVSHANNNNKNRNNKINKSKQSTNNSTIKSPAIQALVQPLNFIGAQNTWGGSVGSGTMTNVVTKKSKTPVQVNELFTELNAPAFPTLTLLAYGNIQPGLAPMVNFSIPNPFNAANLVTPGLGPVAEANINPTTNFFGLIKRTNVMSVCYDKWDADYIDVVYDPGCSGQSTQGSSGEIIIHAEPNPGQAAPTTLVEALRSKWSVSGRACDRIVLRLPRIFFDRKKEFFLRQGPVTWNSSVVDYDAGRIHIFCNGITSGTTGELGRVSISGLFHLYDDIDPGESTSIAVAPPSASILFGMASSIMPITNAGSNSIFQCLLQGDNTALDVNGLPIKMNTSISAFTLPPGNYGFEAYFNPTLSVVSTGAALSSVVASFGINATNANTGVTTIAADTTALNLTGGNISPITLSEDRTVIVRGYWRSPGSSPSTVSLNVSTTLLGGSSISWNQVANNWTGNLPNAGQGNILGCLLRVFTL